MTYALVLVAFAAGWAVSWWLGEEAAYQRGYRVGHQMGRAERPYLHEHAPGFRSIEAIQAEQFLHDVGFTREAGE